MVTKILFGLKVKMINKPYRGSHIFTKLTGQVYAVESTIRKLTDKTLEVSMKHEEYHHMINSLIFLSFVTDFSLFLILEILYYILKITWTLYVAGILLMLLLLIMLCFIGLVILELVGLEERWADRYAVKKLSKERVKEAILELHKKHILKEDQAHGSIDSRLAYIARIK